MKRLLIIGASIHQLPAILTAKKMGLQVGVADYNPEEIGVRYADVFFNISTIDIAGIIRTAVQFKPHGIMTTATDLPMRAIALAAAEFGLPGISPETAIKATDKGEMIKAFKSNAVEAPWFFILGPGDDLDDIRSEVSFPCIIKPTDNAGSRGVILVNSAEELEEACAYSRQHARSGAIVIEEYLTGSEVSVEIMVVKGRVHVLAVTDKLTTGAPYFVEMGHCQPSLLPGPALGKIKDLARRAVQSVGIENGPAHVEIMLTREGPRMIELGARMGGDFIASNLVPLSTGIDMMQAAIEVSIGQTPDIIPRLSKASAIRYIDLHRPGYINAISGADDAKKIEGVTSVGFFKKVGDSVGAIKNSADRTGYVIAQADSAPEAIAICERALKQIHIKLVASEG